MRSISLRRPPPRPLVPWGKPSRRKWSGKRNNRRRSVARKGVSREDKRLRLHWLQVDEFEEVRHLTAPPWPVVIDVVPPVVEPCGNPLRHEDRLQGAGVRDHLVLPCSLPDAH